MSPQPKKRGFRGRFDANPFEGLPLRRDQPLWIGPWFDVEIPAGASVEDLNELAERAVAEREEAKR